MCTCTSILFNQTIPTSDTTMGGCMYELNKIDLKQSHNKPNIKQSGFSLALPVLQFVVAKAV